MDMDLPTCMALGYLGSTERDGALVKRTMVLYDGVIVPLLLLLLVIDTSSFTLYNQLRCCGGWVNILLVCHGREREGGLLILLPSYWLSTKTHWKFRYPTY